MESVATRSKTRPLSLVTDGSSFVILDSDDYKSVKNRIATFQNWSGALSPDELARTGFIYRNQGDETQCVYCNIRQKSSWWRLVWISEFRTPLD